MMKNIYYLFLLLILIQCKPKEEKIDTKFADKPEVPASIKKTHQDILEKIHAITLLKDESTEIAIGLEELMKHHFKEEEDFILPPLGLLPLLASGQMPEQSKDIILLSAHAKTQMNHMSAEHQLIMAHIQELKQVSKPQNQTEIIGLENEVLKHANSEEEIFFPASILIGEYLKLKSEVKTP